MWNYKNDELEEPGLVLPDYILEELRAEEGAKDE
jgi:hypothetical protein